MNPNPGPAWKAIGTGDFNGDGLSEVLFQNTSSGQVSIWEMDGNKLIGGGPVSPNPGPSWVAIGTGGDGSDILFQNTNGQTSIWDMNGSHLVGGGAVSADGGPNWKASFSASPQRRAKGERGLGDAGFERRRVRPQGGGEMARVDVVGPIPLEAHLGQFS